MVQVNKRGCRKDDEKVDEVTLLKRQLKQKEYELENGTTGT